MAKEYEASKPIYMQIAEQTFKQIVRKEMKPGEKLPSVRDMAIQAGVNPNTVQRSYREMERMGVVETKRGQGTFIVDNEEIVIELKKKMQFEIINEFVSHMKELGLSEEEIVSGLEQFLQEGDTHVDPIR